jgi:hypothetical protein
MALEPGVRGLEPNSNTPRADRPEQLQNGFQTRYGSECLIKGISRKSILTLVRNGKNLAFLLPVARKRRAGRPCLTTSGRKPCVRACHSDALRPHTASRIHRGGDDGRRLHRDEKP